jgi:virginiamycin B lyase
MRVATRARRWSILLAACFISALTLPVAQAAELGTLKHYKLSTSTDPHDVTTASDGNVWFTVQGAFNEETFQNPGQVARVTPRGDITEFDVCNSCIPTDIVQGPDGILYVGDNDGHLRGINTSGGVVRDVMLEGEFFGDPINSVAADSTSIWFTFVAPFNDRIGRYDVNTAEVTFYAAADAGDLAVAADGTVWFTGSNAIGELDPELDPAAAVVSTTPLSGQGRGIAIAPNGTVWVTEIFTDLIARLTPGTTAGPHELAEFPTAEDASPLGIAAAHDGNVWFTQNTRGNIARITPDGVITEASKPVDFNDPKRPDPVGITIGADGKPWYAESLVDKVATLKLK